MSDTTNPKQICYKCGGYGHWSRECTSMPKSMRRKADPVCYYCKGHGHFAGSCATKFLNGARKLINGERSLTTAHPIEVFHMQRIIEYREMVQVQRQQQSPSPIAYQTPFCQCDDCVKNNGNQLESMIQDESAEPSLQSSPEKPSS